MITYDHLPLQPINEAKGEYLGTVIEVTETTVKQHIGKANVEHRREALDRVPDQTEKVSIRYRDGIARVTSVIPSDFSQERGGRQLSRWD